MRYSPFTHTPQSLWSRFAAFMGFLAVLSALAAPVSMLAEDVRTGKLGGLCSLNVGNGSSGSLNSGSGDGGNPALQPNPHCDLCGSTAVALPLLAMLFIPSFAGHQVAATPSPAYTARHLTGLPESRGPPSTL